MMVCCSKLDCYFGHFPCSWLHVKKTMFWRLNLSSSDEGRREGCLLWWSLRELVSITILLVELKNNLVVLILRSQNLRIIRYSGMMKIH
jgi:hypothetical protein